MLKNANFSFILFIFIFYLDRVIKYFFLKLFFQLF